MNFALTDGFVSRDLPLARNRDTVGIASPSHDQGVDPWWSRRPEDANYERSLPTGATASHRVRGRHRFTP